VREDTLTFGQGRRVDMRGDAVLPWRKKEQISVPSKASTGIRGRAPLAPLVLGGREVAKLIEDGISPASAAPRGGQDLSQGGQQIRAGRVHFQGRVHGALGGV